MTSPYFSLPALLPPERCPGCAFRRDRCLCAQLPRVATHTRLVLLQHVKDARRPTNTGRLLAAMHPGVEVALYGWTDRVLDMDALAATPNLAALFPHDDAPTLSPDLFDGSTPPVVAVLDGTWTQGARLARRLARAGVRPVRLPEGAPGAYRLRQSGDPTRLCTIEAAARALSALGEDEAAARLLDGLDFFVARHFQQRGISPVDGEP